MDAWFEEETLVESPEYGLHPPSLCDCIQKPYGENMLVFGAKMGDIAGINIEENVRRIFEEKEIALLSEDTGLSQLDDFEEEAGTILEDEDEPDTLEGKEYPLLRKPLERSCWRIHSCAETASSRRRMRGSEEKRRIAMSENSGSSWRTCEGRDRLGSADEHNEAMSNVNPLSPPEAPAPLPPWRCRLDERIPFCNDVEELVLCLDALVLLSGEFCAS